MINKNISGMNPQINRIIINKIESLLNNKIQGTKEVLESELRSKLHLLNQKKEQLRSQ